MGVWKSFEELEDSLCMPELITLLSSVREKKHQERVFAAALQGVDLEKDNSQDKWEQLKARVASGGTTEDPNDVMSLQGKRAESLGFGIGLGLEAERVDSDGNVTKLG